MPYHKKYLAGGLMTTLFISIVAYVTMSHALIGVWTVTVVASVSAGAFNNYGFEWYGGSKALPEWHPPSRAGAFGLGNFVGLLTFIVLWLTGLLAFLSDFI